MMVWKCSAAVSSPAEVRTRSRSRPQRARAALNRPRKTFSPAVARAS
jgi:hypothetical protein